MAVEEVKVSGGYLFLDFNCDDSVTDELNDETFLFDNLEVSAFFVNVGNFFLSAACLDWLPLTVFDVCFRFHVGAAVYLSAPFVWLLPQNEIYKSYLSL